MAGDDVATDVSVQNYPILFCTLLSLAVTCSMLRGLIIGRSLGTYLRALRLGLGQTVPDYLLS